MLLKIRAEVLFHLMYQLWYSERDERPLPEPAESAHSKRVAARQTDSGVFLPHRGGWGAGARMAERPLRCGQEGYRKGRHGGRVWLADRTAVMPASAGRGA